jgi:hypothetical protein
LYVQKKNFPYNTLKTKTETKTKTKTEQKQNKNRNRNRNRNKNKNTIPLSKLFGLFWRIFGFPLSPFSPYSTSETLASVPAPFQSPVITFTSYTTVVQSVVTSLTGSSLTIAPSSSAYLIK